MPFQCLDHKATELLIWGGGISPFLSVAKPRPCNGTCSCCCWSSSSPFLLVVVGATFILSDLCMIQKNKSIDTSETRYCAKNQPFVTSIFAKGWQKQFCIFCIFFSSWLTKWPQNSNLFWSAQHNSGVPDLFYKSFVQLLFVPQKSILKFKRGMRLEQGERGGGHICKCNKSVYKVQKCIFLLVG